MIKANFKLKKSTIEEKQTKENVDAEKKDLDQKEFEDFMIKSGAAGSFMVFRSQDKESELGIDEL